MALQVWLPLNGNLNNNGVGNYTITNVGATVNSSGKLGQCYDFTGASSRIGISNLGVTSYPISISGWVKVSGFDGNTQYFVSNNTSGGTADHAIGFGIYSQKWAFWAGGSYYTITNTITTGEWHHLAVTIDTSNHCLCYFDGEIVIDTTCGNHPGSKYLTLGARSANGSGGAAGGSYFMNGYLNDVRFYSHALSPKEVEILSRGLVLHYPMTGGGRGQSNLYDFESVASKWTNEGETSLTNYTDSSYGNVLKISSVASKRIYRAVSNVWTTSGGKYTVSFLAKASTNGATCDMSRSLGDFSPTFTLTTNWRKYSGTITLTTTSSGGTLSFRTLSSADYYITQIKLESGEKATAYLPGVNDSHYSAMGYNDNIEYDVSGYLHNGTINGSVSYSSDTPRYSVSSYFNADANYISRNATSGDIRAASFWIKFPVAVSSTYRVAFADYTSRLAFGMINATTACCTCAGNTIKTFTISQFTVDKWYHIVVQYNSNKSDVQLYINGVAQTTRGDGDSWNHTTSTLMLGKRSTGSTINAYISDFRLYATALSEEDIQKLYNTSASIANNGVLMSYEFAET